MLNNRSIAYDRGVPWRLLAVVVAVALAMAGLVAGPVRAFADESASTPVTIKSDNDGDSYVAYELFSGNVRDGRISEVEFGKEFTDQDAWTKLGASYDGPQGALEWTKSQVTTNGVKLADEVQGAFPNAKGLNVKANQTFQLTSGYWLIVANGETNTSPILLPIDGGSDTIVVSPKGSVPTVSKEVAVDDGEFGKFVWARPSVSDLHFRMVGTLPSNIADYDTLHYEFEDVADSTVTLDKSSVKVDVDGKDVTDLVKVTSADAHHINVAFDDIKKVSNIKADSKVTLTVDGKLDFSTESRYGLENLSLNDVDIVYTAHPGATYVPARTPRDEVRIGALKVQLTKTGSSKPLSGAVFTVAGQQYTTGADGLLSFDVVPGDVLISETKAPDGFVAVDPFTVTVEAPAPDEDESSSDVKATLTGAGEGITLTNVDAAKGQIDVSVDDHAVPQTPGSPSTPSTPARILARANLNTGIVGTAAVGIAALGIYGLYRHNKKQDEE